MNTLTERQEKLLNDKPSTLFFKLSVPGVIGMLVFGFYQFIDGIFVGQFVGPAGVGAVGLMYPLSLLNNGISGLIGTGASSLISQGIGKGDKKILKNIFPAVFIMNLVICALVTILSIIFAPKLVSFMGGEGEMLELGITYMRIVVAGTFFINLAASANMMIRSEGLLKQAMYILGVGAILNLILDPLLMVVFKMGIGGAAAATVISQIISMALALYFIFSKKSLIQANFNFKNVSFKLIKEMSKIGFSAMALPFMAIIEIVTAFKMLDLYAGISDVIALSTIFKVFSLLLPPIWGIAQGMQPFVGINYGAGKIKRMMKGYGTFTGYATIFTLIFWSMIIFTPRFV
ncbi:MAG: MATE family efflux transporter, partial [Spirochaetales bacterium]|nr:MATE family efflux transporter [Spirochaetales bacterium]